MRPLFLKQSFKAIQRNDIPFLSQWLKDAQIQKKHIKMMAYEAVRLGKLDIFNLMFQTHQLNINEPRADGSCFLSEACRIRNEPLVELLLKLGADPSLFHRPEKIFHEKHRTLTVAFSDSLKWKGWEMILNHPKITPQILDKQLVLYTAISSKDLKAIHLILKKAANINFVFEDLSPLSMALIMKANVPTIRFLIEQGADPTVDKQGLKLLKRNKELFVYWEKIKLDTAIPAAQNLNPSKPKFL